jgi:hypothetical protein
VAPIRPGEALMPVDEHAAAAGRIAVTMQEGTGETRAWLDAGRQPRIVSLPDAQR